MVWNYVWNSDGTRPLLHHKLEWAKEFLFVMMVNGHIRKVINPIIDPLTEETQEFEEGCSISSRIYKKVERPKKLMLKYLNENGEAVEEIAENFLAVVVQHENDHLDGILFVEKISPI